MKNILLQTQKNTVTTEIISSTDTTTSPIYFWIALGELIIITFLLLNSKKKQKDLKFGDLSKHKLRNAKKSDIDLNNLMNSINGAKDLYKELSRTCHPDRFINSDKQKIAEDIFQNISKNRRDFKKLIELKQRAKIELNINFK